MPRLLNAQPLPPGDATGPQPAETSADSRRRAHLETIDDDALLHHLLREAGLRHFRLQAPNGRLPWLASAIDHSHCGGWTLLRCEVSQAALRRARLDGTAYCDLVRYLGRSLRLRRQPC
jgi:hypothetical protein